MNFRPGDLIYYTASFPGQKPFYEVTRMDEENNKVWVKSASRESYFYLDKVALYEPMTVCKKIKDMEARWKDFQTRKASSQAPDATNTLTATF